MPNRTLFYQMPLRTLALLFGAAPLLLSTPSYAGKYETIIADTAVMYEACMQRCNRQDALGSLTRSGCLAGCAEMRREFPLNRKEYDKYGDCSEDYSRIEVKRDQYIAEYHEWCLEQTPHVHKRQGCKDAVTTFFNAATVQNVCSRTVGGPAQTAVTPLAPSVNQGNSAYAGPQTGNPYSSGGQPPAYAGSTGGATLSGQAPAYASNAGLAAAMSATDTPKYQTPEEVAKTSRKGKSGKGKPTKISSGKTASKGTPKPIAGSANTGKTNKKAKNTKMPRAKTGQEKSPSPTPAGQEKDAPMPEAKDLPTPSSAPSGQIFTPDATPSNQTPVAAPPVAPPLAVPIPTPQISPQSLASPATIPMAASKNTSPEWQNTIPEPQEPHVPEPVVQEPDAPKDPNVAAPQAPKDSKVHTPTATTEPAQPKTVDHPVLPTDASEPIMQTVADPNHPTVKESEALTPMPLPFDPINTGTVAPPPNTPPLQSPPSTNHTAERPGPDTARQNTEQGPVILPSIPSMLKQGGPPPSTPLPANR